MLQDKQQHPVFGGPVVITQQALEEESFIGGKTFLPQNRNLNQTFSSFFAYIDTANELLLCSKFNKVVYGKKLKNEEESKNASVRRGSLLVTGLNAIGPLDADENFHQIGGPFWLTIKKPGTKVREYAKFLFCISEFSKKLVEPENFFWASFDLVPKIFESNKFFSNEPFVLLQEHLAEIKKNNAVDKW